MTSQDLFPISCQFYSSLLWAFYFVNFNHVIDRLFLFSDIKNPDSWRLECSVVEVSPVSRSFRVEEAEVVSPDGQICKYPVLWLITVEMILSFFISYLLKSALIPWFVFIKELAYRKEKLSGQLINKKIGIKWVQQKADIPAGYREFLNLFIEQLLSFSPQRANWEDCSVAH